ncbi:MAG: protein kinase domain-containing protein, partial [Gemmatimonadaceae bacterium]
MTVETYRLLSVLGTGSMSVVYLAQRLDDVRVLVAVKLLYSQTVSTPEDWAAIRMRFQREARAASKLRNENILPVLSSGDVNGVPYMVLPVIVGGTLATRLANHPQPMPLGEIARYLTQLANAIDYAHEQGVVHRDIKPSNILLDEHGHVYLTDFGIARLFDSGDNALTRESAQTLTRTGQVLGTPYYMAPEQIKGRPIGPACDIYALGVVLYQLVTGQVPFHGDTPLAVALQHLQEPPSPPGLMRSELPPPVEAVILRALAKDPEDRYTTATELAVAFEAGLAEIEDPMATRAPTETWPFSTGFTQRATTADTTAATPIPRTTDVLERLAGATVNGYRIGALIESNELGTVFTANRDGSSEPDRIRFLPIPPSATGKQIASYLLRFEQQAHELAQVRHPHLVPVLDYGTYEGLPYVVTPDDQGRSLSIELAQHGPAELSAIAECLDQIVAALDCAQERGFLHLSLTPDCIFRQDDGTVLVADVGIRGMLEQDGARSEQPPLYVNSEGDAPEQLLGKPVGPYTDVYGLGAVLYQMLTGHEVFTGNTRDDIAQQHLHASIPPLRRWRPSLPTALDRVVASAMAKEPQQRFQSPRGLAEAYRTAIAKTQSQAAFAVAPANPPAHWGTGSPRHESSIASATGGKAMQTTPPPSVAVPSQASPPAMTGSVQAAPVPAPAVATTEQPPTHTRPPIAGRLTSGTARFIVGIVLLVSLTIGAFAWFNRQQGVQPGAATGAVAEATLLDNSQNGLYNSDALNISVTGMPSPQQGHWYQGWLINDQTEHVIPLGKLVPKAGQGSTYTLRYAGDGSPGHAGTNLLEAGDRIKITSEAQNGQLPAGPVALEGAFPPNAFQHIRHLLVAFPTTPQHQGLLVGTMQQMNLLNQQANVLQQWIGLHYPNSTKCGAQSVIDIIEGSAGANYKPLGAECNIGQQWPAGDGYGLLGKDGYLAGVADHAALAASTNDASPHIRMHSGHVQIAVANITGWLQTVDQDAVKVLAGARDANTTGELVSLS